VSAQVRDNIRAARLAHIKPMIILLHGPDAYRRSAKRRDIVREFKAKHPMSQTLTVDIEEDAKEFRGRLGEATHTRSMFDPAELFLLDRAYDMEKKDLTELILPYAASPSFVFLLSEDTKPTKPFETFLKKVEAGAEGTKKAVMIQEFEYPEGAAWATFIKKAAEAEGFELSPDALTFLAGIYAKDTWGLMTELAKLGGLAKKKIERKDIELADAPEIPNFFAMLGALQSPRPAERLSVLAKLLGSGEPAAKIFHILSYQGANPMRFAKYDAAVKSGKFEYEEALLDALL
jgi:DNA polymerase III delta subunit